uniref:NB-ARC domain-containing protein n=1 Tax=Solanum lycopersicum TaxID=4081 RepID=A0A3Q7IGE1_SOLLC
MGTLVHHMELLCPITDNHKDKVAFKDRIIMLNFLRENLINLPREALEDFDTAIINVGLLVYSICESKPSAVVDFLGDIQSIQALIYFLTWKSFHYNLPKIDGLGSIDTIIDHLKEFLSRYAESLSSIRSQLQKIKQQLEQHDGFGSLAMQVIAKAYVVDHLVVSSINKDILKWCLFLWFGDIIEEITLLMGSMSEEMVGFDEVVQKLRQQLSSGSSKLDVISIVGMPGLGKTTLANKLFFDQFVVSHFDVRAQCCVSQLYIRKDLFFVDTIISDKLPENELADKLRKLLMVQRIILTTRLGDVAYNVKTVSDNHFLRMFTPEESWMLLKNKIAQKCGGLPLSVVLVAGILETMEKEKHCWEQDEEIQVSKLTWLWTAESLVKSHKEKLSEDIAEYYLRRNLVMVFKKSCDGKTMTCRIHYLLLEFFKKKAKVAEDSSLSFSYNRWNLETLIVKGLGKRVTLPDTLWKMVKLRHLHIYNHDVFNKKNALREMDGLRTLSSAWYSCVEETNMVIAKIPKFQKLRCGVFSCNSCSPAFNILTEPEMIKFSWGRAGATELNLPSSLKKLRLSIGCISMTHEHFPHLKFFKLQDLSFFEWNVSSDACPCLEHLVLTRLRHLEQIPSCFEEMMTLK